MRKKLRKMAEKIGIYPIWLILRYYLFEYSYEKKRGKMIEKNMLEGYSWLREYKNKYRGERCFVICNGPSLTKDDYIKLKNEHTFGMNMIYRWFDETGIETEFLVIQDYFSRAKDMGGDLKKIERSKIILSDHMFKKYGFTTDADFFLVPASMKNLHFPRVLRSVMIDEKMTGFSIGNSVALLCVELAMYMGFDNIYVLGADCSFDGGTADSHADGLGGKYESENQRMKYISRIEREGKQISKGIIDDYIIAEKYAKKNGINLFNATRGGRLEVLERVDFDKMLMQV